MIVRTIAAVAVATVAIACGKPNCDDVEAQLAKVVNTEPAAMPNGADMLPPSGAGPGSNTVDTRFLPLLGDVVPELVGRCRTGKLGDEAIRCLVDARRVSDVDRCARHGL
jgi:hypothetical protein